MNNSGTDLIKVLNQVQDFFGEVAALLLTADSLMAKADWISRTGNTAISGMSYSLYYPRQWLPNFPYRFYENKNTPHLLPLISTIISVGNKKDQELLPQPLISAALYEYQGNGEAINTEKYYEFASWHLWMPNRRNDGTICELDPRIDPDWANECSARNIKSFALPLFDISDANTLQKRIIEPLLTLVAKSGPS